MKNLEFGLTTDQKEDRFMLYMARIIGLNALIALIVLADTLVKNGTWT